MNENYIAVDIGASSGRLMLAEKDFQDKITLNEVHRFKNGFSDSEGTDHWNADHLVEEILIGLEKVKQRGIEECYVGIDTWGVDYCLLDEEGVNRSVIVIIVQQARWKRSMLTFPSKNFMKKQESSFNRLIRCFNY